MTFLLFIAQIGPFAYGQCYSSQPSSTEDGVLIYSGNLGKAVLGKLLTKHSHTWISDEQVYFKDVNPVSVAELLPKQILASSFWDLKNELHINDMIFYIYKSQKSQNESFQRQRCLWGDGFKTLCL